MPVIQVYLPSKIARKVYYFAETDGIDEKEWIQKVIGEKVSILTDIPLSELLEKQKSKKSKKEGKRAVSKGSE